MPPPPPHPHRPGDEIASGCTPAAPGVGLALAAGFLLDLSRRGSEGQEDAFLETLWLEAGQQPPPPPLWCLAWQRVANNHEAVPTRWRWRRRGLTTGTGGVRGRGTIYKRVEVPAKRLRSFPPVTRQLPPRGKGWGGGGGLALCDTLCCVPHHVPHHDFGATSRTTHTHPISTPPGVPPCRVVGGLGVQSPALHSARTTTPSLPPKVSLPVQP